MIAVIATVEHILSPEIKNNGDYAKKNEFNRNLNKCLI